MADTTATSGALGSGDAPIASPAPVRPVRIMQRSRPSQDASELAGRSSRTGSTSPLPAHPASSATPPTSEFKRETPASEGSSGPSNRPLTIEERQDAYEKARARIFGSSDAGSSSPAPDLAVDGSSGVYSSPGDSSSNSSNSAPGIGTGGVPVSSSNNKGTGSYGTTFSSSSGGSNNLQRGTSDLGDDSGFADASGSRNQRQQTSRRYSAKSASASSGSILGAPPIHWTGPSGGLPAPMAADGRMLPMGPPLSMSMGPVGSGPYTTPGIGVAHPGGLGLPMGGFGGPQTDPYQSVQFPMAAAGPHYAAGHPPGVSGNYGGWPSAPLQHPAAVPASFSSPSALPRPRLPPSAGGRDVGGFSRPGLPERPHPMRWPEQQPMPFEPYGGGFGGVPGNPPPGNDIWDMGGSTSWQAGRPLARPVRPPAPGPVGMPPMPPALPPFGAIGRPGPRPGVNLPPAPGMAAWPPGNSVPYGTGPSAPNEYGLLGPAPMPWGAGAGPMGPFANDPAMVTPYGGPLGSPYSPAQFGNDLGGQVMVGGPLPGLPRRPPPRRRELYDPNAGSGRRAGDQELKSTPRISDAASVTASEGAGGRDSLPTALEQLSLDQESTQ